MEGLIGVIILAVIAGAGFLGKDFIVDLFKGELSTGKKIMLFSVVVLMTTGLWKFWLYSNDGNAGRELPILPVEVKAEEAPAVTAKSDAEIYTDAAIEGVGLASEGIQQIQENSRRKDSIRRARRKSYWVYKIGLSQSDEEGLYKLYEKLKNQGNIHVFKEDRKHMYIVKMDGKNEEELRRNQEKFKAEISHIEANVEVVNLTDQCENSKDKIMKGTPVKVKRKVFLDCLVCG